MARRTRNKQLRQERAAERDAANATLTLEDKLAKAQWRVQNGIGSCTREIARLQRQIKDRDRHAAATPKRANKRKQADT